MIARYHERIFRDVQEGKIRLLCETDLQALLEACRDLARRHPDGLFRRPDPEGGGIMIDANDPLLPEIIAALRPNYVGVDRDGQVQIGMYTGRWPFGVRAFPEDYQDSETARALREYEGRVLVEGLWYFEYGYWNDPAGYDRRIDELLKKNKTAADRTTKQGSLE